MAAKYSEFEGEWDDVDTDGMWQGHADDQDKAQSLGEWEDYDNESLPYFKHFEKMNQQLQAEGLIIVWYWYGGDPGMGGASRLFHLPPDRIVNI